MRKPLSPALVVLALSACVLPAATGSGCEPTPLPSTKKNCSHPGLEHLRPGQYEGLVANYLSYLTETSSPQFQVRALEFQACTGGRINFTDTLDAFVDPIRDLGNRTHEGTSKFDAYFMSYSHFPEASASGLAETLNDRIRRSMEHLQWEDVYATVKILGQYRRNGRNDLDFLMFDGDFFVPLVRLDLLEKFNKPLPSTWEELVHLAHFFHGRDLNEDGEPDYGLCHFPKAGGGFWNEWWPELIYATWATMAQTDGHSQGFLFDPRTFVPNLDSASFRKAVEIWKQLTNVTEEGCITDNVITGRCAIGLSPPGCWKGVFLNGMARRDPNGTVLWQPTLANGRYAEPYRLQPFGSLKVEDPVSGELVPCSRRLCRYAEPVVPYGHVSSKDRASILPPSPLEGQLINRAPFFWSGGLGTLIRKSAAPEVKDMLWDYFVYINSPVTSVEDVATYSSWIDSWRHKQLTVDGENFVKLSTWSPEAYAEHRSVMDKSLGKESNAALNLRIPGIKAYTYENLGRRMTQFIEGNITTDELVAKLTEDWLETTSSHGLLNQLETYRAALGLEALTTAELCLLHRREMDLKDPALCFEDDGSTLRLVLYALGGVTGGLILLSFAAWVFVTARAKRRLLAEQKQRMHDLMKKSLHTVGTLNFPMVLVPASSYLRLGRLICNESLRDRQDVKLRYLDRCCDVDDFLEEMNIVFLSHQWLGYVNPDPMHVQYDCSCRALRKVVHDRTWSLSKTYVWVDFCCIPQRCSSAQMLAITSLPIYASKVSAFIIISPTSVHLGDERMTQQCSMSGPVASRTSTMGTAASRTSTNGCSLDGRAGAQCCLESYKQRAWCRAEVLSHALSKGVSSMYVATERGLAPVVDYEALIDEAIYVFEGDLTCCKMKHQRMDLCDRQRLVVPFLGLYSYVIHSLKWKSDSMDQSTLEFFRKILAQKERVFPATFRFETPDTVEKVRPLFKGLLEMMEEEVKKTQEVQFEEFRIAQNDALFTLVNQSHSVVATFTNSSMEEPASPRGTMRTTRTRSSADTVRDAVKYTLTRSSADTARDSIKARDSMKATVTRSGSIEEVCELTPGDAESSPGTRKTDGGIAAAKRASPRAPPAWDCSEKPFPQWGPVPPEEDPMPQLPKCQLPQQLLLGLPL